MDPAALGPSSGSINVPSAASALAPVREMCIPGIAACAFALARALGVTLAFVPGHALPRLSAPAGPHLARARALTGPTWSATFEAAAWDTTATGEATGNVEAALCKAGSTSATSRRGAVTSTTTAFPATVATAASIGCGPMAPLPPLVAAVAPSVGRCRDLWVAACGCSGSAAPYRRLLTARPGFTCYAGHAGPKKASPGPT